MAWLAGADSCPAGWFRVSRDTASGELRFDVLARAELLVSAAPVPAVLGIDIPIGLTDAGPRDCDRMARKLLGRPRGSSVFPAPIRPALGADSRFDASHITTAADGRGVAAQAWGIYRNVREVDELMRADPAARDIVYEVHPEVSFWKWSGERPIVASKKTDDGRRHRLALVERRFGAGIAKSARGHHLKKHLADDDILDAFAALWTAERIARGVATTLPEAPPRDSAGLPMRIVY